MRPRHLVATGLVLLASAGSAGAEETTRVYRQGGSTAMITQEGGGSADVRRSVTGQDGQVIIQQQGGATAVVRQNAGAMLQEPQFPDRLALYFRSLFDWVMPRVEEDLAFEKEEDLALEEEDDEAPRSPAERRIAREFGMDLQVSNSFRSRFLDRMTPRD